MKQTHIERQFAAMGARFRIASHTTRSFGAVRDYFIDIQKDRRGEFFALSIGDHLQAAVDVTVLQKVADDRHLLLLVKKAGQAEKDRFLCGHDERSWFVAAVPGNASTVAQAKEALKPPKVQLAYPAGSETPAKMMPSGVRASGSSFRRRG